MSASVSQEHVKEIERLLSTPLPIVTLSDGNAQITEKADATAQEYLKSAHTILETTRKYCIGTPDDHTQSRTNIKIAYAYVQNVVKVCAKKAVSDGIQQLKESAQALKIHPQMDPKLYENKQFAKFAKANRLHHAFFTTDHFLGISEENAPIFTFIDEHECSHRATWDQITVQKTSSGYELTAADGTLLAETLHSFELKPEWVITHRGIERDTKESFKAMRARQMGDLRPSYYIRLVASIPKGQTGFGGFTGQHTYLEMGTPREVYTVGKYPRHGFSECTEMACVSSRKEAIITSPDVFAFFDPETRDEASALLEVTEDQFTHLVEKITQEKRDPTFFSVLENNCTAYFEAFFKNELGIELETKLSIGEYFWQLIPSFIRGPVDFVYNTIMAPMPQFARTLISVVFYPAYYVYSVAVGLLGIIMGMGNHQGIFGQDVSLWKVLTNSVYVSHPVALKDFLRRKYPTGIILKDG